MSQLAKRPRESISMDVRRIIHHDYNSSSMYISRWIYWRSVCIHLDRDQVESHDRSLVKGRTGTSMSVSLRVVQGIIYWIEGTTRMDHSPASATYASHPNLPSTGSHTLRCGYRQCTRVAPSSAVPIIVSGAAAAPPSTQSTSARRMLCELTLTVFVPRSYCLYVTKPSQVSLWW
jgi:hypothetical protein